MMTRPASRRYLGIVPFVLVAMAAPVGAAPGAKPSAARPSSAQPSSAQPSAAPRAQTIDQPASRPPVEKSPSAQRAEELFRKGRKALERRDYDAACAAFGASLELEVAAGTAMNLAACEESRSHLARAWKNWQLALRLLEPDDPRYPYAQQRERDLDPKVPHLTIFLHPDAPANTTVTRDGEVLDGVGRERATPIDPGTHELVVSAPGHESRKYALYVPSGEKRVLQVMPGARAKPAQQKDAASERSRAQRIVGGSLVGLGVGSLAAAVTTGILLDRTQRTFDENCTPSCNDEGEQAARRGRTLLRVNTATFIAGALGIVGGSILLFTLPKARGVRDAALSVSPHKASFSVRGTF